MRPKLNFSCQYANSNFYIKIENMKRMYLLTGDCYYSIRIVFPCILCIWCWWDIGSVFGCQSSLRHWANHPNVDMQKCCKMTVTNDQGLTKNANFNTFVLHFVSERNTIQIFVLVGILIVFSVFVNKNVRKYELVRVKWPFIWFRPATEQIHPKGVQDIYS